MSKTVKIIRPDADEMCPPGYHKVRGYDRTCKSGTKTWVDAHNAKNPTRKAMVYHGPNLLYLFWHADLSKFPLVNPVTGFSDFHEIDRVIGFWLAYWQSQGLEYPAGMNSLVVKALIAVESSFNASRVTGQTGGRGLMQLLKGSVRVLSGINDKNGYREVKNQCLAISLDEVLDPIINIAAGTRWLAHKYSLIRPTPAKTLFNTLKNYNQNNSEGEEYARRILDLYNASK
ncbi:MAG: hypothetical protein FJ146_17030 [Deltaproteobacteria bacterium]|nr:hypothetical protein [Deltaproteobacteria bacterium]